MALLPRRLNTSITTTTTNGSYYCSPVLDTAALMVLAGAGRHTLWSFWNILHGLAPVTLPIAGRCL